MKIFVLSLILCAFTVEIKAQDQVCQAQVGDTIPSSKVFSRDAKPFQLNELVKDRNVVLVFYRGGWCGYCMKHLSELKLYETQFDSLGYDLVAISTDDPDHAEEVKNEKDLEFEIYSDHKMYAAHAMGIAFKVSDDLFEKYKGFDIKLEESAGGETHHELPHPAVYLLKNGVIQFEYVNPNYSKRLSSEALIAIMKSID